LIGYDSGLQAARTLNGRPVAAINANLTAGTDLTKARRLTENLGLAFMADTKGGAFEIREELALYMTKQPNPEGRDNRDVVRPWVNGLDVTRRPRHMWIVDFGVRPIDQAALYEAPFEYVKANVYPVRRSNAREAYARKWWLHVEPRPGMRRAVDRLARFIVTPTIAKHRLFVWMPRKTLPDHQLIVIAADDDYIFGMLNSLPHRLWALRMGTQLETRPRYTPTTTFETFPFPKPTGPQRSAIAALGKELDDLRSGWLNPPGLSDTELEKRTLTELYNANPTWLCQVHDRLDQAVFEAYGWASERGDDDILALLLSLNLQREAAGMPMTGNEVANEH
jgi:hypothetical protein